MNWREHIERDPQILAGKPRIRGTRLSVELVVGRMGDGWTTQQLLEAYPQLSPSQIQACLAYAADALAGDEVMDIPLGKA